MEEISAQLGWMAVVIRVGAAVVGGMLVGLEREFRDKPAGLRTMILISAGACVFSMISHSMGGKNVDATRIAAQIVTGVGFLGAGSILRSKRSVYGLTTAASIWMVAAIGMACGFGRFDIALVAIIGTLLILVSFQSLSRFIEHSRTVRKYRLLTGDADVSFAKLEPLFSELGLSIVTRNCYQDGNQFVYTFRVRGPIREHLSLRERLMHMDNLRLQK